MSRAEMATDQWARERPDLPSLPMLLLGRLLGAAELIMRDHMSPLFAEAGLQHGEFDVLATLRRSGAPFQLTPTQLYEALMISSGGMTARLDRLEQAGLVERLPNPKDRRGRMIALTKLGKQKIDATLSLHVANEQRILSSLTAAEQDRLNALLGKLIAGL